MNSLLTKPQTKLYNAICSGRYSEIFLTGSIRSSKTYGAVLMLFLLSLRYKESKWIIIRKTWNRINDAVLPTIVEVGNLFPRRLFKRNGSDVLFFNGSEIIIMSESYNNDKEMTKLQGIACSGFLLDEIPELEKKTYIRAIERAGSLILKDQPKKLIIATANPPRRIDEVSQDQWFRNEVFNSYQEGRMKPNQLWLPFFLTDNPYLSKDYIESLEHLPPDEYRRLVLGNWSCYAENPNAFFYAFNESENVCDNIEVEAEHGSVFISVDANARPYCCATIWQNVDGNPIQIDEVIAKEKDAHVTGLAMKIDSKLKYYGHENIQEVIIYGDASLKANNVFNPDKRSFIQILADTLSNYYHGVRLNMGAYNPSVVSTGTFVNDLFRGYKSKKIKICKRCQFSISDYVSVQKAQDGTMQKKRVDGVELAGHLSDTLRYFVYSNYSELYYEWLDSLYPKKEVNKINYQQNIFGINKSSVEGF